MTAEWKDTTMEDKRPWSNEELELLRREVAKQTPIPSIVKMLGRNYNSVSAKAYRLSTEPHKVRNKPGMPSIPPRRS